MDIGIIAFIFFILTCYILGFFASIDFTQENIGCTTQLKARHIWLALFWPIIMIITILKGVVFITHEFLSYILYGFGCKYKTTATYKKISNKLMAEILK